MSQMYWSLSGKDRNRVGLLKTGKQADIFGQIQESAEPSRINTASAVSSCNALPAVDPPLMKTITKGVRLTVPQSENKDKRSSDGKNRSAFKTSRECHGNKLCQCEWMKAWGKKVLSCNRQWSSSSVTHKLWKWSARTDKSLKSIRKHVCTFQGCIKVPLK